MHFYTHASGRGGTEQLQHAAAHARRHLDHKITREILLSRLQVTLRVTYFSDPPARTTPKGSLLFPDRVHVSPRSLSRCLVFSCV